ncbi:Fic family protein [Cellulomonas sp. DKR-3]|uniref:Fic family protein n=2 Tax=Cellulomonas fulva TaxID=2835530 RepID=A0ABS5TZY9_9CELL|nr:Fic family protein [Cellulomonas fulva]
MLTVPALSYEEHEWLAETDGMTSRARLSTASGPYRSSVPPVIAGYVPSIPADLAADVEEATAALTQLDVYAYAKLGADSPTLGPMSSILLRTESASSSQIENLTVGARQLALAEIGQSTSDSARTVIANVRTMEAALALAERLDEDAILAMHRELLSGQRGWEKHAGRYRDSLVWVGTSTITPRGASHVAPQPGQVPAAMDDLVRFMARDDVPVLVQAAVAHAQFETIHPFTDGNGRTGRAMVHAILRGKGTMTRTTAPVSAGLLTDTAAYFGALDTYRKGDARPIVEQFARASRYAASTGVRLVDDLSAQVDDARTRLAAIRLRPQAAGWIVVPLLVSNPVVNSRLLARRLGMRDMTAQRALAQLTEAGVLTEKTGMQRNRVWQHSGILGVLDQYAQHVRRR